jgi:heme iron utilization protein
LGTEWLVFGRDDGRLACGLDSTPKLEIINYPVANQISVEKLCMSSSAADTVRRLIRTARHGALGTLRPLTNAPYVSLVLVAPDAVGRPLFLLSMLAVHTGNLLADPRASLLLDASDGLDHRMAGTRVSLTGRVDRVEDSIARAEVRTLYLACHAGAATYADFSDFAFYRMTLEDAHLIEGFGRIVTVSGPELMSASGSA